MVQMVNSKQKQLDTMAIVHIALQNTNSGYPLQIALPAIITEASQPNTVTKQVGNTLFILHKGQNGTGVFKALNADIAPNFVANSKQFVVWAAQQGMKQIVVDFNDPNILRMIQVVASNSPIKGASFEKFPLKNGGTRVLINLGGGQ